jgi:hypothetical protein
MDLLKNPGLSCDFGVFGDFSKLFLYSKSHGSGLWIMGPRLALGPWWTRDHGQRGRSKAWEVIVIAWREGEEVLVLTNGATWRRSCGDGHMTVLNRGGWWCSNGELVLGERRIDWSWGWCGG